MADDMKPDMHVDAASATAATQPHMISILDSSVLFRMIDGSYSHFRKFRGNDHFELDSMNILDELMRPPNTVVIPRTVLQEIFINGDKSYGIAVGENGEAHLAIPEEAYTSEAERRMGNRRTVKGTEALYWKLRNSEIRGRLRYYDNAHDMLASGDWDRPEGGIIIVDSADESVEPVNETGEYTKFKKGTHTADNALRNILHAAYDLDSYERKSNRHVRLFTGDYDILDTVDTYRLAATRDQMIIGCNMRTLIFALKRSGQVTQEALEFWRSEEGGKLTWYRAQEKVEALESGLYSDDRQAEIQKNIIGDLAELLEASDPMKFRQQQASHNRS